MLALKERRAFDNGSYHALFAEHLQEPGMEEAHVQQLLRRHMRVDSLLRDRGVAHPLSRRTRPKALQIGVAAVPTAEAFVTSVLFPNPNTHIVIADTSPYPINAIANSAVRQYGLVSLLRAEASALPFPDETFEMVETDGLLQFVPPEQKKNVYNEWFRVLKPGGIVTTQDWVLPEGSTRDQTNIYSARADHIELTFGVRPYPETVKGMTEDLETTGFSVVLYQENPKHIVDRCLHDIIAIKP